METKQSIDIGMDWVDVNAECGIAPGTEIILQNNGRPQDRIQIATRYEQPADDFPGVILTQSPMMRVDAGKPRIWAKLTRFDREPGKVMTAPLQVQIAGEAVKDATGTFGQKESAVIEQMLGRVLSDLIESNRAIEAQLKLLNLRYEEACNTGITKEDT